MSLDPGESVPSRVEPRPPLTVQRIDVSDTLCIDWETDAHRLLEEGKSAESAPFEAAGSDWSFRLTPNETRSEVQISLERLRYSVATWTYTSACLVGRTMNDDWVVTDQRAWTDDDIRLFWRGPTREIVRERLHFPPGFVPPPGGLSPDDALPDGCTLRWRVVLRAHAMPPPIRRDPLPGKAVARNHRPRSLLPEHLRRVGDAVIGPAAAAAAATSAAAAAAATASSMADGKATRASAPASAAASTSSGSAGGSAAAAYGRGSFASAAADALSDVSLRTADGVLLPAHRLVLCSSPVFAAALTTRMGEAADGVVHLPLNADAARLLLHAMYTGSSERVDALDSAVTACALYSAAHLYQIPSLFAAAGDAVVRTLTPQTMLSAWKLAVQFESQTKAAVAAATTADAPAAASAPAAESANAAPRGRRGVAARRAAAAAAAAAEAKVRDAVAAAATAAADPDADADGDAMATAAELMARSAAETLHGVEAFVKTNLRAAAPALTQAATLPDAVASAASPAAASASASSSSAAALKAEPRASAAATNGVSSSHAAAEASAEAKANADADADAADSDAKAVGPAAGSKRKASKATAKPRAAKRRR